MIIAIDEPFGLQPEIYHQFKEPVRRAPKELSTLFTYLVLAPLVILLIGWLKIGLNFANIPTSGLSLPSVFIFHGCIGFICYILYLFWIQLNVFETLYMLLLAFIPTYISGYFALKGVAMKREMNK